MSRILGGSALLLACQPAPLAAQPDPAASLVTYRALTSVEPRCARASGEEIMVCGRRQADRWRIPFIAYSVGDPRAEGLPAERVRIQHETTPCQDMGPFLVGCGMVGVTVGTSLDGAPLRLRPLAP